MAGKKIVDVNAAWESLMPNPPRGVGMEDTKTVRSAARKQRVKQRKQGGFTMSVKKADALILNQDAVTPAFTIATVVLNHIQGKIGEGSHVADVTRQRRARKPSRGRYPRGYQPNPEGPYGIDSGYLRDELLKNIELVERGDRADVLARMPKRRQKAAFVLRGIKADTGKLDESTRRVLKKATEAYSKQMWENDRKRLRRLQKANKDARAKRVGDILKLLKQFGVF